MNVTFESLLKKVISNCLLLSDTLILKLNITRINSNNTQNVSENKYLSAFIGLYVIDIFKLERVYKLWNNI